MNVGFLEIAPERYPFTISIFHHGDTKGLKPLFTELVTGPGALVIPQLRKEGDPPVWIQVRWADGTVDEYGRGEGKAE